MPKISAKKVFTAFTGILMISKLKLLIIYETTSKKFERSISVSFKRKWLYVVWLVTTEVSSAKDMDMVAHWDVWRWFRVVPGDRKVGGGSPVQPGTECDSQRWLPYTEMTGMEVIRGKRSNIFNFFKSDDIASYY